ncbi:nuclear fragile X mental retardation-interacting protein 1-domain-containing protein [Mycena belliarum]|uniref:Nuclear fragile X mental retardation-interacting protein 1-domain-containing protein n=1 Tax=Mycena belliarum TaxID=1033014 RepID=A0AAD6UJL9_9AGAR|nr:nuclear fragile X mental retardation-interacting protein 1-domain-containing protein [Mycena belliae]
MQHPWPPQHYSSHYAQAYMQQQAAAVPQQGYSLPSPYNPSVQQNAIPSTSSAPWYQPGSSRCTYKTCTFRGSPQTVEIHMMDRHLIHPAGWEKRKKQPEWDADPSLKGKPIPIQGTTVVLDTPEQLEAWIAERRRRWPSAQRVEDKKRKMEEAMTRMHRLDAVDAADAEGVQDAIIRAGEDVVWMGDGEGVAAEVQCRSHNRLVLLLTWTPVPAMKAAKPRMRQR